MQLVALKPINGKPDEPMYHVHSAGCPDLNRRRYDLGDTYEIEADSLSEVAQTVYPPDAFDYDPAEDKTYEGDFRAFPCAGLAS